MFRVEWYFTGTIFRPVLNDSNCRYGHRDESNEHIVYRILLTRYCIYPSLSFSVLITQFLNDKWKIRKRFTCCRYDISFSCHLIWQKDLHMRIFFSMTMAKQSQSMKMRQISDIKILIFCKHATLKLITRQLVFS